MNHTDDLVDHGNEVCQSHTVPESAEGWGAMQGEGTAGSPDSNIPRFRRLGRVGQAVVAIPTLHDRKTTSGAAQRGGGEPCLHP